MARSKTVWRGARPRGAEGSWYAAIEPYMFFTVGYRPKLKKKEE